MEKFWKLTDETKEQRCGTILRRLEIIKDCRYGKAGTKGGWIEKESNLSGNAWVHNDAMVYNNARVFGRALVYDNAWVSGNAEVSDKACVSGNAWVSGDARVYENANVSGCARLYENARVYGNAMVYGNAWVSNNAKVYGDSWVTGHAAVCGDATVTGLVYTTRYIHPLTLTDNHIKYGCYQKTIEEWEEWLNSDEEFEIKRTDPKFKLTRLSLELAIEQHKLTKNYNGIKV